MFTSCSSCLLTEEDGAMQDGEGRWCTHDPGDGVQLEVRVAAMWAVNEALGLTAIELQSLRLQYGHRFLLEARKAQKWILEPPYDLWPREIGLSFLRRFRSIMSANRVCGQAAVIALRDRMEFWLARGRPMVTREDMLAARDAALINCEGLGLPPADYEVWNWLGSSYRVEVGEGVHIGKLLKTETIKHADGKAPTGDILWELPPRSSQDSTLPAMFHRSAEILQDASAQSSAAKFHRLCHHV